MFIVGCSTRHFENEKCVVGSYTKLVRGSLLGCVVNAFFAVESPLYNPSWFAGIPHSLLSIIFNEGVVL
jgi:hypothetical protein